jgi:glucosamine 6-phosphate synthetase-like amidotransferase/phosphosugar isomerase protein
MVDNFKGVFALVGFNIPQPDTVFFASADEPCNLGNSVVFLKAVKKKFFLVGRHVIKLTENKLFLSLIVKEGYVFRKTRNREESAGFKVIKFFTGEKLNIAEYLIVDCYTDFISVYKIS